jgi:Phosphate transport regulator (distant homolog of PhoU)
VLGEGKMFRVTRKEEIFFDMFVETAESTLKAASLLEEMVNNYVDVERKVAAIEQVENDCDKLVHKILEQLNKSFITPIDREDIYLIAKEIDNITDAIESTAHRFIMFNVKKVSPETLTMTKYITEGCKELTLLCKELKDMKTSKVLIEKVVEINRIEDEVDDIFRKAIKDLFSNESNAVEIIMWKEIYEYLENTLDSLEDVANIIEGVVTKHA